MESSPAKVPTTRDPRSNLALVIAAANRDRRRWPDADQLRIDRPDPKPVSFGHGIHYCLVAALARLEMRVAIPAFGDYTIDENSIAWKQSTALRGITHTTAQPDRSSASLAAS